MADEAQGAEAAPVEEPKAPAPVKGAPWIPMYPKEVRGEDMHTWGASLADQAAFIRRTVRERNDMAKELEGLKGSVPASPEDYSFTIDEKHRGMVSADDLKEYQALAAELKLPVAAAQRLLEFETKRAVAVQERVASLQKDEAKKTMEVLGAIYKDKTKAVLSDVDNLISKFGDPELRKEFELNKVGEHYLGNHPSLLKMLAKISQQFVERGAGTGAPGSGGTADTGEIDLKEVYPLSWSRMTGKNV